MTSQSNILLESGTNELEIIEFYLDEVIEDGEVYRGYYGINVIKVLEIIQMPGITELPQNSTSSILGTFNLRDRVIPLVDIATTLGKTIKEDDEQKVIVTEFNEIINAFKVSGVTRIHRLSWEQITPPGKHLLAVSKDSITGVVKIEDRVVFILDMEKIITDLNPRLALWVPDTYIPPADDFIYKVLTADDSAMIRTMLSDALKKMNFEVTATINGKEAWETLLKIRATAEQEGKELTDYVHVIISDIEMPGMDGHNLTKQIKEDPYFKKLPVLLFSSLITEGLRHKGEAVGADDQMSKPDMVKLGTRAQELARQFLGMPPLSSLSSEED